MASKGRLVIGALIVLAIIIIAAWGGSQSHTFPDGAPVSVTRRGGKGKITILRATYGNREGSCPRKNVTKKVRALVNSLYGSENPSFIVSPTTLGVVGAACNAVRELTIRYTGTIEILPGSDDPPVVNIKARVGGEKQRFAPVPELTCGPDPAPEYAVDVTGRGAVGTVVWEPFASGPGGDAYLERFAPVPELTCGPDPAPEYAVDVTGRGAVGTVVWEPFISSTRPTEVAPSQSVLAKLVRRSPLTAKNRRGCQEVLTDVDSDLDSEGISDSTILCENLTAPKSRTISAERLLLGSLSDKKNAEELNHRLETVYRNPHIIRTPANLRMGLGSLYRDPRFQPGPQERGPGGGGFAPASGTSAGGPAASALTTYTFMPGGTWDSVMVKGFGWQRGPDDTIGPIPVETAITNSE